MPQVEDLVSLLIAGAVGLVIGYIIGKRSGSTAEPTYTTAAAPPPRPVSTNPVRDAARAANQYEGIGGRTADRPAPRPQAQQQPAPRAPVAPQPPPPPQRPDDDRTVIRKLRSARDAFKESKDHLDQVKEKVPDDDSLRFGRKKSDGE